MKQAVCLLYRHENSNLFLGVSRRGKVSIGLPGGKVDPGETPLAAALREFHEECGVQLEKNDVFKMLDFTLDGTQIFVYSIIPYLKYEDIFPEDGLISGFFPKNQFCDPRLSEFFNENAIIFASPVNMY